MRHFSDAYMYIKFNLDYICYKIPGTKWCIVVPADTCSSKSTVSMGNELLNFTNFKVSSLLSLYN